MSDKTTQVTVLNCTNHKCNGKCIIEDARAAIAKGEVVRCTQCGKAHTVIEVAGHIALKAV